MAMNELSQTANTVGLGKQVALTTEMHQFVATYHLSSKFQVLSPKLHVVLNQFRFLSETSSQLLMTYISKLISTKRAIIIQKSLVHVVSRQI